jgi:hypothetical protein
MVSRIFLSLVIPEFRSLFFAAEDKIHPTDCFDLVSGTFHTFPLWIHTELWTSDIKFIVTCSMKNIITVKILEWRQYSTYISP